MLNSLTIENFTVFRKAAFEFVPGINVLVGANATGKTHVMKLLYAMQSAHFQPGLHIAEQLLDVFRPENMDDLIRQKIQTKTMTIKAVWNGQLHLLKLHTQKLGLGLESTMKWEDVTQPVFIPVQDILAHSVGFLSLYDQRNIDFDRIHRDILLRAFTPTLRDVTKNEIGNLLERLSEQLQGRIEVKGERFYLDGKNGRFEMHMVAEGWRKIALLYQLIANGSLSRGSVLYWDEPETNLNPSLMDEVVGVLLELARTGVQIFLSTHDYIILKELDLQKQAEDSLRMFAMERIKKDGSVIVHPADNYLELSPNLIAAQFERIYDLEIDRALGS